MKVYVVYQSLYGDLLQETGVCTEIISVYDNLEKAKNKMKEIINAEIELGEQGFILDNECEENDLIQRLFWERQENWNCYYEIIIEEKEVE